jgi:hypothetical protein
MDVPRLVTAFFTKVPDPSVPALAKDLDVLETRMNLAIAMQLLSLLS